MHATAPPLGVGVVLVLVRAGLPHSPPVDKNKQWPCLGGTVPATPHEARRPHWTQGGHGAVQTVPTAQQAPAAAECGTARGQHGLHWRYTERPGHGGILRARACGDGSRGELERGPWRWRCGRTRGCPRCRSASG